MNELDLVIKSLFECSNIINCIIDDSVLRSKDVSLINIRNDNIRLEPMTIIKSISKDLLTKNISEYFIFDNLQNNYSINTSAIMNIENIEKYNNIIVSNKIEHNLRNNNSYLRKKNSLKYVDILSDRGSFLDKTIITFDISNQIVYLVSSSIDVFIHTNDKGTFYKIGNSDILRVIFIDSKNDINYPKYLKQSRNSKLDKLLN